MEPVVRVVPRGCEFSLDVPVRLQSLYETRGHEPFTSAVFRASCRDLDVVVDVGAHVGYFSLMAATSSSARIVAVEPSPGNAEVLASNLSSISSRTTIVQAALGESPGTALLEVTEASDNCSLSGHPNSPTLDRVPVAVITGADLPVEPGQRVLVKVDVEGHELGVLTGLESVIDRASEARLFVELNPKCVRSAGGEPNDILVWLAERDYRVFALDESGGHWREIDPAGPGDADAIAGSGYVNLYCIPRYIPRTLTAVMHSSGLAGSERSHVELVEDLMAAGWMVHTVVPSPDRGLSAELRRAGSSVSLVDTYPWWTAADPKRNGDWRGGLADHTLTQALLAVDADLVLTHTVVIPQGALAAAALDKPHVWWIHEYGDVDHGLRLPYTPEEMGRLISLLSDSVITNSAAVREHFFPHQSHSAAVVPYAPRLAISGEFVRPERPWTIGVVGNLHPGKGHVDAIAALAEITSDGVDARLLCIGALNPEHEARLSRAAESEGVADRVSFTGFIQDRSRAYAMLDAVAVTSRAEAYGRVPFEAAASGVPVVYADAAGALPYMQRDITGIPYQPGDPHSLAEALRLLRESPELRDSLVEGARRVFQRIHDDPRRMEALLEALETAADRPSVPPERRFVGKLAAVGGSGDGSSGPDGSASRAEIERSLAVAARDEALRQRDRARLARAAAEAHIRVMENSRSWRLTRGLRALRRR